MELNVITKDIPTKFIDTEFGEIKVGTLFEVLDGLEDSCMMATVVIYDPSVEKWLLTLDIIHKNAKGSVYVKDEEKYRKLLKALYKAVEEE